MFHRRCLVLGALVALAALVAHAADVDSALTDSFVNMRPPPPIPENLQDSLAAPPVETCGDGSSPCEGELGPTHHSILAPLLPSMLHGLLPKDYADPGDTLPFPLSHLPVGETGRWALGHVLDKTEVFARNPYQGRHNYATQLIRLCKAVEGDIPLQKVSIPQLQVIARTLWNCDDATARESAEAIASPLYKPIVLNARGAGDDYRTCKNTGAATRPMVNNRLYSMSIPYSTVEALTDKSAAELCDLGLQCSPMGAVRERLSELLAGESERVLEESLAALQIFRKANTMLWGYGVARPLIQDMPPNIVHALGQYYDTKAELRRQLAGQAGGGSEGDSGADEEAPSAARKVQEATVLVDKAFESWRSEFQGGVNAARRKVEEVADDPTLIAIALEKVGAVVGQIQRLQQRDVSPLCDDEPDRLDCTVQWATRILEELKSDSDPDGLLVDVIDDLECYQAVWSGLIDCGRRDTDAGQHACANGIHRVRSECSVEESGHNVLLGWFAKIRELNERVAVRMNEESQYSQFLENRKLLLLDISGRSSIPCDSMEHYSSCVLNELLKPMALASNFENGMASSVDRSKYKPYFDELKQGRSRVPAELWVNTHLEITQGEKDGMAAYTGDGYRAMNKFLRSFGRESRSTAARCATAASLLRKMPPRDSYSDGWTRYRYTNLPTWTKRHLQNSGALVEFGFTSTSVSRAWIWGGQYLLKVQDPCFNVSGRNGDWCVSSGRYVSGKYFFGLLGGYSSILGEYEGTRFQQIAPSKVGWRGTVHVEMTEVLDIGI